MRIYRHYIGGKSPNIVFEETSVANPFVMR